MIKIEKNKIILGSYDIDHIFSGINKKENKNILKEYFKNNFEFEVNLSNFQKIKNIYDVNILLPKNKEIEDIRTSFDNFEDLFTYIYSLRFNTNVVPYYGIDI